MIDDLRAMAIFAEMARQGSFRGAATALGLSPSVVSYHISQLEKRVGTALIYRSTRKLSLTHEGEVLCQHAREMMAAAELGIGKISNHSPQPGGRLIITLPSALTRAPVSSTIARFSKRYPQIALDVRYTDVRQDLIADGIDLAIRVGKMQDSGLKSRLIGPLQRKLVCSADYLAGQPLPTSPRDLRRWHWIRLAMLPDRRTLIDAGGKTVEVQFDSLVRVDSVEAMTWFCQQGLGLATPPEFLVRDALDRGELKEVLPQWQVEPIPLYAVWPANVSAGSNTRRVLDFLTESE